MSGGAFVAYQSVGNGPRARELDVGLVIRNLPQDERVLLHTYKSVWRQLRVCHYPLYRTEPEIFPPTPPRGKPRRQSVTPPSCSKWSCCEEAS